MKKVAPLFLLLIALLLGCSSQTQGVAPEYNIPTPTMASDEHDRKIYIAAYDNAAEKFGILSQKCIYVMGECGKIEFLPILLKQDVVSSMFWAPDGSKFATVIEENGNQDIALIDPNGQNSKNITNSPEIETMLGWSSDSTKIIFQKETNQNISLPTEVWIMGNDGGNAHKLVDGCCAQMSSDGKIYYLAPQNDGGSAMDVYVAEIESSSVLQIRNLTNTTDTEGKISVSPDGQKIAFTSSLPGDNPQLYLMNSDGTNRTRLAVSSAYIDDITWSPDGNKIAFTSSPSHTSSPEVYVLDLRNRDYINLSNSVNYASRSPAWSPNSDKIIFISDRDSGLSNIYVVNVDGSNLTRLTNATANLEFLFAAWQP